MGFHRDYKDKDWMWNVKYVTETFLVPVLVGPLFKSLKPGLGGLVITVLFYLIVGGDEVSVPFRSSIGFLFDVSYNSLSYLTETPSEYRLIYSDPRFHSIWVGVDYSFTSLLHWVELTWRKRFVFSSRLSQSPTPWVSPLWRSKSLHTKGSRTLIYLIVRVWGWWSLIQW